MRILVIHQNFPGQFKHIAKAWAERPGWQVIGIGREGCPGIAGVRCIQYKPHRDALKQQHHYLNRMESAVLHGQAVARLLLDLKRQGFTPDAILAHPGWGETLYAKDVFPKARLIHFCEWFYNAEGADVGFDPEFPVTFDDHARIRTWNALHLLNLENCDVGVSPTHWQKNRHPAAYQDKIVVAHEGIDTDLLGPDPNAQIMLNGREFKAGDPIITYVARNLEPYRGFHVFMRALERIQKEHKSCQAIIVGGDDVSYGRRPSDAKNWREKMLREVTLDASRTHFVGKLPYDRYRKVLQVSAAHLYLTYPFVLSWSMLEAMASGCLLIASKTAPVEEVVRDGVNGKLIEFHDLDAINAALVEGCSANSSYRSMRSKSEEHASVFTHNLGVRSYDRILKCAA